MNSEYTVLNNQIDYLLGCRRRNDRELARSLRKLLKHVFNRKRIPLDHEIYPDQIGNDLREIEPLIVRLVDYFDNNVMTINHIQLSIPFSELGKNGKETNKND